MKIRCGFYIIGEWWSIVLTGLFVNTVSILSSLTSISRITSILHTIVTTQLSSSDAKKLICSLTLCWARSSLQHSMSECLLPKVLITRHNVNVTCLVTQCACYMPFYTNVKQSYRLCLLQAMVHILNDLVTMCLLHAIHATFHAGCCITCYRVW